MNDNHDNDYQEQEGQYRHTKRLERALVNRDPFYPNELHEADVRGEEPEETIEDTFEELRRMSI